MSDAVERADVERSSLARRQRATRHSIQRALLEAAAEHGLDTVTVERVCRSVGISPRTFFNYFPSKEAALVSPVQFEPTELALERFAAQRGDPLADLVRLITDSLVLPADERTRRLLGQVLKDQPGLIRAESAQRRDDAERVLRAVEFRLACTWGAVPYTGSAAIESRARLLTALAATIVRSGVEAWLLNTRDESLSEHVTGAAVAFAQLVSETDLDAVAAGALRGSADSRSAEPAKFASLA